MDIMLDIETLATSPEALVLSIGAVAFSLRDGLAPVQFYSVLTVDEQANRTIDPATVGWWIKQIQENEGATNVLNFDAPRERVERSLQRLDAYYQTWCTKDSEVWANDPDFDCVIVGSLYGDFNLPVPWKFWQHRSFRTLKKIGRALGIEDSALNIPNNMQMHNALADAVWQAEYCMAMQKEIGVAA